MKNDHSFILRNLVDAPLPYQNIAQGLEGQRRFWRVLQKLDLASFHLSYRPVPLTYPGASIYFQRAS